MTANYVPAAAVIHRSRALFGFIGRKASAGGRTSFVLKAVAQQLFALNTVRLEYGRKFWNLIWSGGMCRYIKEHQRRRRKLRPLLTLRLESVGSKWD